MLPRSHVVSKARGRRVSAEIAELVGQATPYVTAALRAYGGSVMTRAEEGAADATANLGRRLLQAFWHRGSEAQQAALETAVGDAAEDVADDDAAAALRQQLKRALREDADLRNEIFSMLPTESISFTASGERSVAAQTINGVVTTGDNAQVWK